MTSDGTDGTGADVTGEEPRVVVRDRRRVDPESDQVRPAEQEAAQATGSDAPPSGHDAELAAQLEERTADLQRLQAEYANYRKRIDRDREVVVASAKASVATELLGVLDDIERADAHGDLTGAFKAVADKLSSTLERVGLESFGHEGEPFDPSVHEAVQHATSPEVSEPTVTAVLRRGYRIGDRVLRAAMVGVTDHEPGSQPQPEPEPTPEPVAEEPPANDWFAPANSDASNGEQ